ncbi:MAG: HEAT repeat domain-containing protein, partial [Elusimicrobia bacterium]|nr:HEAT repeat domain-containing protein [Elusimicrobiota bacterium]
AAQALSVALSDPDPGVKAAAAIALGEVGGDAAIDVVKEALAGELEPFQRNLLAASLKKLLR